MTEKRFQMIGDMRESYIKDNDTGDAYYFNECVQVLNNIAEENRQLKQSLQNKMESDAYWEVKAKERVNKLEKENKELKQREETLLNEIEDFQELLTKLDNENEQLKQENNNLRDFRGFITEKNVFNEKERKELQLQLSRLYNYFENYFEDTMSPNAFSEMWDNVKEDER